MTERRSVRRAVLRDLGGPGQELPAAKRRTLIARGNEASGSGRRSGTRRPVPAINASSPTHPVVVHLIKRFARPLTAGPRGPTHPRSQACT
jgi:hypothetical protein